MAVIVDGNTIANTIQAELRERVAACGVRPRIDIFRAEGNAVIERYVARKRIFAKAIGATCTEFIIAQETTTEELIAAIEARAQETDGIVVQLPLPSHIERDRVLAAIPPEKDIDNLSQNAAVTAEAPVAGAVREIIERHAVALDGKRVVIVGRGRLVGMPVATYFGQTAVVDVVTLDRTTSEAAVRDALHRADIVVSGIGVPHHITVDMIADGVVLLDAGTSSSAGTVVGDIAPECEAKAALMAKTPGGIGPITIAILFSNLVAAACGRMPVGNEQ